MSQLLFYGLVDLEIILGNEWFDLYLNDDSTISFSTINDGYWEYYRKEWYSAFIYICLSKFKYANLGYMVLTVPRSDLAIGKRSLKISIQGRSAENEIWYRLFAYKDALKYAIEKEHKSFFFSVEFKHMGDAIFTLCAPLKNINSEIQLYNSDTLIAEGLFTPRWIDLEIKYFYSKISST